MARPATGQDLDDAAELADLRRDFTAFEILHALGRGGMGVVYRARQRRLDRPVALKVLAPELANDPAFAERFLREARALAKLNHPNVVQVYDFGEVNGRYFLAMELVEGVQLRELLRDGALAPAQALAIVPALCQGLQYAHENGVVHRDIKPENILLDRTGRVKIADFGLAKLVQPNASGLRTRASQVMGTPQYMAPEQLRGPLAVDHRADIYSLGIVFYELLTGELPIGAFPPASSKSGVDVRIDRVVEKALQREPDRRYQAAEEVRTDVEDITATRATSRGAETSTGSEEAASAAAVLEEQGVEPWERNVSPTAFAALALAVAAPWVALSLLQGRASWLSPSVWGWGAPSWSQALGLAYPLTFLARRAARSIEGLRVKTTVRVVALSVASVALFGAMTGFRSRIAADVLLELAALTVVFFAHDVIHRWVRCGDESSGLYGASLLAAASIAHGAYSYAGGSREAFYFCSGISAVLGFSSLLVIALDRRRFEREGGALKPLRRALVIAVGGAGLYFKDMILY